MARSLVFGLVGVVGVAAAGVSGFWWWQTDQIEKQIANIPQNPFVKISYQGLHKAGFPFKAAVKLDKPVLDLTLPITPAGMQLHVEYSDYFTFSKSLMHPEFQLEAVGTATSTAKIGQQQWSQTAQSQGANQCNVKFDIPWSVYLGRSALPPQAWAEGLRSMDCAFPEFESHNAKDNQLLAKSAASSFSISHSPADTTRTVGMTLKAPAVQFTQAYDVMANEQKDAITKGMMAMMPPGSPVPTSTSMFAQYGAIQIDIGVKAELPKQLSAAALMQPMSLTISPFIFHSAVSNSDFRLEAHHQPDQTGKTHATLDANYVLTVSERGDAVTAYKISELVKNVPMVSAFAAGAANYTPDQLWALVQPALPHYAPLGTITTDLKLDYNGTMVAPKGTLDIGKIGIDFTPYGVTGNGKMVLDANPALSTGALHFECRACSTMLDDFGIFAAKVQKVAVVLKPDMGPAGQISWQEGIAGTKQLLAGIAKSSPETTEAKWVFNLEKTADGKMSVNQQPLQQYAPMLGGVAAPATPGLPSEPDVKLPEDIAPNVPQAPAVAPVAPTAEPIVSAPTSAAPVQAAPEPTAEAAPSPSTAAGMILDVNLTVKSCDADKIKSIGGDAITKVDDKGPAAQDMHTYQVFFDSAKIRPDVLMQKLTPECYKF